MVTISLEEETGLTVIYMVLCNEHYRSSADKINDIEI